MASRNLQLLTINDLLDSWRTLGALRLPDNRELIGESACGQWMHVLWEGVTDEQLAAAERRIGRPLPRMLRALYRCVGGVSLFSGLFRLANPCPGQPGHPTELLCSGSEDAPDWLPDSAVVIAHTAWDNSMHVVGMNSDGDEVARCEPRHGTVADTHADAITMLAERLVRIDDLIASATVTGNEEDTPPQQIQAECHE